MHKRERPTQYEPTRNGSVLRTTRTLGALVFCALAATSLSKARAGSGITIEAVNTYAAGCQPNLPNCISNVDGFRTKMLGVGSGFTAGLRFTEGSVFVSDFTEAQDHANFDRNNNADAIGYFHSHGFCDDIGGNCTTSANCNAPPAGSALPGICLRNQESPSVSGRCVYNRRRVSINGVCGVVDYTNNVRWGESAQSGAFAGAGTNGGVNFVVLDNSCGIRPNLYIEELWSPFAGISTIATIMPSRAGDDTINVNTRGVQFATRYKNNFNSSIAKSWADTINSVSGGSSCPFGGGGHGINGCGAYIAVSADSSAAGADWARDAETWVQVRDDNNDATGNAFYSWTMTCNYDCNAHPFQL